MRHADKTLRRVMAALDEIGRSEVGDGGRRMNKTMQITVTIEVPEWAKWMAMDECGEWWFYEYKPCIGLGVWNPPANETGACKRAYLDEFPKVDWTISLQAPPFPGTGSFGTLPWWQAVWVNVWLAIIWSRPVQRDCRR